MPALPIPDLIAAMAAVDIASWGLAARAHTVPLDLLDVPGHGIRFHPDALETAH
jgi:L-alanine-DL-glutamate epimerase-like enolase superfamily enzyme